MTQRKADKGLDFETLRLGFERCEYELVLGFYAEDAELSIVNADTPHASPFELRGKADIAKYLRAIFGQGASHRVEREVLGEDRVTYREACEYPDGSRVMVETTLEVREDKIVRQVDVVSVGTHAGRKDEIGQRLSTRKPYPRIHPGADASASDRLLRS
jgi:hypothetical protein